MVLPVSISFFFGRLLGGSFITLCLFKVNLTCGASSSRFAKSSNAFAFIMKFVLRSFLKAPIDKALF